MHIQLTRALLLASLTAACSVNEIDRNAAGSATHSAYVVVNDRPALPTLQAYIDASNARADALAAAKCGSMRVEEVSRVRQNANSVLLTFRCQP